MPRKKIDTLTLNAGTYMFSHPTGTGVAYVHDHCPSRVIIDEVEAKSMTHKEQIRSFFKNKEITVRMYLTPTF